MSTMPPFKLKTRPLAGQEALQRRLGLDDDAYNYLMSNACRLADHLRETGAPPFATWVTCLMALGLLGSSTLGPEKDPRELANVLSEVLKENMPDCLASAVEFVRVHLPPEGGGGENALETAWDNRVNPAGPDGGWMG